MFELKTTFCRSSRACIALSIARIFSHSRVDYTHIARLSLSFLIMATVFLSLSLLLCDSSCHSDVDGDSCTCFPRSDVLVASIVCKYLKMNTTTVMQADALLLVACCR